MIAVVLGVVVFQVTRRVLHLLWEFPTSGDLIVHELPWAHRRLPLLRTLLSALADSSRDGDDFQVGYDQRNPDVAALADRLDVQAWHSREPGAGPAEQDAVPAPPRGATG